MNVVYWWRSRNSSNLSTWFDDDDDEFELEFEGFGTGGCVNKGVAGNGVAGSGVAGNATGLASIDGVVGALENEFIGAGVGASMGSEMVVVGMSFSIISGLPKSQRTPCLAQLPHRG